MNMKKFGFIVLCIALLVMSSVSVMAEENEETKYSPAREYGKHMITARMIENYMDEYDLTEENTIGDLLDAIEDRQEEMKDEAKEKFGVETDEELKEAIFEQKIDHLRDTFDLSEEEYTDEEVIDYVREYHRAELIDLLDLEEDASDEEIKEALKEWKEEHKHLLGPKWKFRFRGWFK